MADQKHENALGNLQHPGAAHLAQPAACRETAPLSGVRAAPRAAASRRTVS